QRHASAKSQVVVASIQTLAVSPKRLDGLNPETFGAVVIDEAHHAPARTYLTMLARLGLAPDIASLPEIDLTNKKQAKQKRSVFESFKPPKEAPYLIGFTATPHRSDGIGLECVFDEIAYQKTIEEMMKSGWLSKIIGKRIQTESDLSGVKISHGDYQEKELSATVNTADRNGLIVKAYEALAMGRRALCFCVDVQHTIDMTNAFCKAGLKAMHVIGETPTEIRSNIIKTYKVGELDVLCNCMVLTEGFDAPETSCIIMARPTKSSLLYTQMLGRGTRIAPNKENLLVIDMADAGAAGVASLNTLFGLPPKLDTKDQDVLSIQDEIQAEIEGLPEEELANIHTIEEVRQLAQDFNPLMQTRLPGWIDANLAWVKTSYGYALGLKKGHVGIVVNLLGQGTVKIQLPRHKAEILGHYPNEQDAISFAEQWVSQEYQEDMYLLDRNAKWRTSDSPPSDKQVALCERLRIKLPPNPTKGQAQAILARHFAERGNHE
ncbi:MAG: DEAD/DEAH box helicase, partial [Nitrososphaera sp.]